MTTDSTSDLLDKLREVLSPFWFDEVCAQLREGDPTWWERMELTILWYTDPEEYRRRLKEALKRPVWS